MKNIAWIVFFVALFLSCSEGSAPSIAKPKPGHVVAATPGAAPFALPTPQYEGLPVAQPFPSEKENDEVFEGQVEIRSGKLYFLPSPIIALSIYEGLNLDYSRALVELSPVAVLPAAATCSDGEGRCRVSPVEAEAHCKGCEKLVREKSYTVFLIRKRFELPENVLSAQLVFGE